MSSGRSGLIWGYVATAATTRTRLKTAYQAANRPSTVAGRTRPTTQTQAEAAATGALLEPPYDPSTTPGNLNQGAPWVPRNAPASSQPPNLNTPWSAWNRGGGQQFGARRPGFDTGSYPGNTITPGYGVRGPVNPPGSPASYEMMSGMVLPRPQPNPDDDGGDYKGAGKEEIAFDAKPFIAASGRLKNDEPEPINPAQLFSGARGLNAASLTNYWNRWREYLNPMVGLVIRRVINLIQYYQIGLWADYQWTLFWALRRDATLIHLMKRRVSAILSRTIQQVPFEEEDLPPGWTLADAEAQCASLKQEYVKVENWREALTFLEGASVHGYAHLEKVRDREGCITRLECVKQWHWCKKSWYSDWLYNAAALQTNNGEPVDLSRFVIRDETNDVFMGDAILTYYVRLGLCEKNWDAFVEIFGIPRPVVTGPDPRAMGGVGFDMQVFNASAIAIANGGTGALPFGSTVTYPNEVRGNQPFHDRADWLVTKITQMLTGSSLTSETKEGSGTLAGHAHSDSWDEICAGEADAIGEILDRQLSTDILLRLHPGEPRLCRTILGTKEQQDSAKAVEEVLQLTQAGFDPTPEQIKEMTGWDVTKAAPEPVVGPGEPSAQQVMKNRMHFHEIDSLLAPEEQYAQGMFADLEPFRDLWNKLKISGPQDQRLDHFFSAAPGILASMKNREAASALQQAMLGAFSRGLRSLQPA